MKRIHPLAVLLLGAIVGGGGCYTVLRHPATYELTDQYGAYKACADCHEDAELYHYTEAYGASWYSLYPAPWAIYYQSPWWYSDYWYYESDPNDPGIPVERGGRHIWSRGSGGGPGFIPYQGDQLKPPVETGKPDRTTPPDGGKPDQNEKEKEKKKRNLWGR